MATIRTDISAAGGRPPDRPGPTGPGAVACYARVREGFRHLSSRFSGGGAPRSRGW